MPAEELMMLKLICKCSPIVLKQKLFTCQVGLAMAKNHYFFEVVQDIVEKFIPMGIMQYLNKLHIQANFKQAIFDPKNNLKVLNVDDLAFGFYIWLGACLISVCGFFLELTCFSIRKYCRNEIIVE